MFKKVLLVISMLILGLFIFLEIYTPPLSANHGKIQTKLYLGEAENQPLVVGFGGGEGGNAWASDYWQETRDRFINEGYAFLAIGYFGMENTPANLDRISLNAIHDSIISIAQHPKINNSKIAIIGGSKGGELVLNLAARYDDIDATIAIVTSHVSFPALTSMANTSSWTYHNEEIPFVPAPYKAVPSMIKGDLHGAFTIMLENEKAVKNASIEVEKINGSILLLSATQDEFWPSYSMSNQVFDRLKENNFAHYYQHIPIDGGHAEPLKHFDEALLFLENHFKHE